MINAQHVLTANDICVTSALRAIQDVRNSVENASNPLQKALNLIYDITGIQRQYTDVKTALHVAQACAETAVKSELFEPELAVINGEKRDAALRISMPWMYVEVQKSTVHSTQQTVVAGIDTKVAVLTNGNLKKGGKQTITQELYKKHVLDATTPMTNKEFKALLTKELGLSGACASTYSYNSRKALGGDFKK